MTAFIDVRVDNVLAILKALGVDLSAEECRSQFRGALPPEQANSNPALEHTTPALFVGLSSGVHPETVSEQTEFHRTFRTSVST